MKPIEVIEVKSELGAGTRGASMGVEALKVVCLNKKSDFFTRYRRVSVETENEVLFYPTPYKHARYINVMIRVQQRVCETVARSILNGDFAIVLAGDHSTAAGTIAGIKKAYPNKRLGVVWIDAHADMHSPHTTPSGNMHGMPLAIAIAEDNLESKVNSLHPDAAGLWQRLKDMGTGHNVEPEDIVYVSMRDTEVEEQYLIKKYQIKNYPTDEVRSRGVEAIIPEIFAKLAHCDLIYVSFDVDSTDPKISEGTGTPVEGGLSIEEAMKLNTLLVQNEKVCCWEMVEINPTLDYEGNLMAENAFDILVSVADTVEKTRQQLYF